MEGIFDYNDVVAWFHLENTITQNRELVAGWQWFI